MARALANCLRSEVKVTPFCPGCGHGILLGLILRAIGALGWSMNEMLFVSGIGCAAWISSPNYKADTLHTLHGRAVAFATGAKLANPALRVLVISGDGDLASIGGNHLIHAARRGIDLTVICANNQIYGMTGGQLAPTTPKGCRSATTVLGNPYPPFDLCRLVKASGGSYVARGSVLEPYQLMDEIQRALITPSFSFVEAMSPCPTQFGRRNRLDTPARTHDALRQSCRDWAAFDEQEVWSEDVLPLGEYSDE